MPSSPNPSILLLTLTLTLLLLPLARSEDFICPAPSTGSARSCPINCFRPDPVCGVDGVTSAARGRLRRAQRGASAGLPGRQRTAPESSLRPGLPPPPHRLAHRPRILRPLRVPLKFVVWLFFLHLISIIWL
ncbi:uncharacterized protein A4U43_C10F1780 [Asparagus officinalis]|uniref:Uncharacterized protein n=1 Tax=Asparagus officinalis TaxID=4686 RepID=A0A5P1E2Y7_ASPOF|nr:uncharacterized protein A4U43_C10F1780 [Asparagus officinalis]